MRIGIVNDMTMAVEVLKRVVRDIPEYEIAWVAYDGREAVNKCTADTPDIVLMDLIMPNMDGVEATRRIMKQTPCAILVVTATVEGNMAKVFDAMGYGALDAATTPVVGSDGAIHGGDVLLGKIATIAKLLGKNDATRQRGTLHARGLSPRESGTKLVVIGSSTGGPKALAEILSSLPRASNVSIVIVQHVDVQFASGLVEWLNEQTPLAVCLAMDGMRPQPGTVLVAGTNDHLVMKSDLTLHYTPEPEDCPYRPSVDILFKSVARTWPEKAVGVVLTGMGSDGAEGLMVLRDVGWHTIAQDEKSCVVYGMPKAAAMLGAAVEILPPAKIAKALTSYS